MGCQLAWVWPPSGARTGDSSYYQEAVRAGAGDCGTQGSTVPEARGGRLIPQPCQLPAPTASKYQDSPSKAWSQSPCGFTSRPAPHCPPKGATAQPLGCRRPVRGGVPSFLPSDVSETPFTCDVLRSPKSMTPESPPQRTVLAARGRGEDGGGRGRAGPQSLGGAAVAGSAEGSGGWRGGLGEEGRMLRLSLSSCRAPGTGLDGW